MNKIPITKTGFNVLKKKLIKLKKYTRPKIINEIKTARDFGDLKENAEYHAAKEQLLIIENKINDLEKKISLSNIINIDHIINKSIIAFGATVDIQKINTNQIMTYQIVGETETNLTENKISIKSPMALALILKSKNDIINIKANRQNMQYRIINITYI